MTKKERAALERVFKRTYITKKLVEEGFTVEELTTYRIQEVLKCSTQLPLLLNGLA